MRRALSGFHVAVCLGLCAAMGWAEEEYKPTLTLHNIEQAAAIEGKWSFTSRWSGYMGLAFEFANGNFKYWFYSDVKREDEPAYPITGTYEISHGILRLKSDKRPYDTAWILITYDGKQGLFPLGALETIVARKETPDMRMLYQVPKQLSDRRWPIMNMPTEVKERAP